MPGRHGRTVVLLLSVVVGMVGLSFASVPLYQLFCAATGYGGTTQRAAVAPQNVADAVVTVRFDADTAPDLGWDFRPLVREVKVHPGEQSEVFFRAVNRSTQGLTGRATFNVTPMKSQQAVLRRYFRKRAPPGEVDDLIQEAFVRLFARRLSDPIENAERYLFRVAAAVLSDHRRRTALRRSAQDQTLQDGEPLEPFSPERIVIAAETLDRVLAALDKLPSRTRDAFILHRFEHRTYREIAQQLGVTTSGVEKLIMRALSKLMADFGAPE